VNILYNEMLVGCICHAMKSERKNTKAQVWFTKNVECVLNSVSVLLIFLSFRVCLTCFSNSEESANAMPSPLVEYAILVYVLSQGIFVFVLFFRKLSKLRAIEKSERT